MCLFNNTTAMGAHYSECYTWSGFGGRRWPLLGVRKINLNPHHFLCLINSHNTFCHTYYCMTFSYLIAVQQLQCWVFIASLFALSAHLPAHLLSCSSLSWWISCILWWISCMGRLQWWMGRLPRILACWRLRLSILLKSQKQSDG